MAQAPSTSTLGTAPRELLGRRHIKSAGFSRLGRVAGGTESSGYALVYPGARAEELDASPGAGEQV